MIQEYEQTTFETCLSVSLLNLLNVKISKKKELELFIHALKFSKKDFSIGHLDYVVKKFNKKLDLYVDEGVCFNYIKQFTFSKKIFLIEEKINIKLVNKLLEKKPTILYIDSYYLYKIAHYPHFIIVIKKVKEQYEIFDPWDGKIKQVPIKTISKAIISLRNHIKLCPKIIQTTN